MRDCRSTTNVAEIVWEEITLLNLYCGSAPGALSKMTRSLIADIEKWLKIKQKLGLISECVESNEERFSQLSAYPVGGLKRSRAHARLI